MELRITTEGAAVRDPADGVTDWGRRGDLRGGSAAMGVAERKEGGTRRAIWLLLKLLILAKFSSWIW
jgi:hypothetical protein